MIRMVITVLVIWLALSVLTAVFVAALGRAGLREDEAMGHLSAAPPEPSASRPAEIVDHPKSA